MNQLQQFFENLALTWDESQPEDREQTLHHLLSIFDEKMSQHRSVLEVGTGTGALIPVLNERYPSARVISIDIAHNMMVRARKRVPAAELTQCDIHQLPFLQDTFDIAICHNCFPHFSLQSFALLEIKRVLVGKGDLLIFHDISREHVNRVHQEAENEIIHDHILPKTQIFVKTLKNVGFSTNFLQDSPSNFIIYANSQ